MILPFKIFYKLMSKEKKNISATIAKRQLQGRPTRQIPNGFVCPYKCGTHDRDSLIESTKKPKE